MVAMSQPFLGAQTSPVRRREMMDAANIGDYLGIYGLCKTASYRMMPSLFPPGFGKVKHFSCSNAFCIHAVIHVKSLEAARGHVNL